VPATAVTLTTELTPETALAPITAMIPATSWTVEVAGMPAAHEFCGGFRPKFFKIEKLILLLLSIS
jgi:hypothetical protein